MTKWPRPGLDDTAPRPACPVGRPPETRSFAFYLASREQPDDPSSGSAKAPWLWGSVEPQLSAHTSSFSPCPYAHDDKWDQELLCFPRRHKAMNEQKRKEVASDVAFEDAPHLPRPVHGARPGGAAHLCWVSLGVGGTLGRGRMKTRGALGPRGGTCWGAKSPWMQLAVSGPWTRRSAIYPQWQVRFGQVAFPSTSMSSSVR